MLNDFDQMFLTNSILKVVPVKSLGKKNFYIGENLQKTYKFFNIEDLKLKKKKSRASINLIFLKLNLLQLHLKTFLFLIFQFLLL